MSWEEHSEKLRSLWEVFLVFTSGIFLLLCFGTPYWEVDLSEYDAQEDTGVKRHAGLWICCIEKGAVKECRNSDCNIPGHVIATQVLMCLAFIFGLVACTVAMVSLLKWRRNMLIAAASCFGTQAFWSLLGLSIYSRNFKEDQVHSGWSYTLGWISFVLASLCSVYYLITCLLYIRNGPPAKAIVRNDTYSRLRQWEDEDSDEYQL